MKIAAADDERLSLNLLTHSIEEAAPDAEIKSYLYQSELIADIDAGYAPDVAFLDIEMPGMSGMEITGYMQQKCPRTGVVFVTGYPDYALEAYRLHARGFVTKPATAARIREELDSLAALLPPQPAKRVRVQCFGNFEIFVDGGALRFERSRTKELLAYLVDRKGAAVNTEQLCAVLWEDSVSIADQKAKLRHLLSDLSRTLQGAGAEEILSKQRNSFAVVVGTFDCDYYDYTENASASVAYRGEYMSQYTWAEMTLGALS